MQWSHPVVRALRCAPRTQAAADSGGRSTAPRDSQAVVSEDQLEIPALHWHAGWPWQAGNSLCGCMLQHALVHCQVHPSCKCSRELEYTCTNILLQGMADSEVMSCTISRRQCSPGRRDRFALGTGGQAVVAALHLAGSSGSSRQRRGWSGQGRTSKTYGGTPCSSGGKGMPCSSIEPRQPCS